MNGFTNILIGFKPHLPAIFVVTFSTMEFLRVCRAVLESIVLFRSIAGSIATVSTIFAISSIVRFSVSAVN